MAKGDRMKLHQLTTADTDTAAAPLFCWITDDGDPQLIGEPAVVLALRDAINAWSAGDVGEPIADTDPAWGNSYDIGDAVAEAVQFGYADNPTRLADTIRAACRAGRIRGATQTDTGRWLIPKRTFRHWLTTYKPKHRQP